LPDRERAACTARNNSVLKGRVKKGTMTPIAPVRFEIMLRAMGLGL